METFRVHIELTWTQPGPDLDLTWTQPRPDLDRPGPELDNINIFYIPPTLLSHLIPFKQ